MAGLFISWANGNVEMLLSEPTLPRYIVSKATIGNNFKKKKKKNRRLGSPFLIPLRSSLLQFPSRLDNTVDVE